MALRRSNFQKTVSSFPKKARVRKMAKGGFVKRFSKIARPQRFIGVF